MKEFVPTPDFTMNDFEQNFCLFRFKESSNSIRLEYYNLRFPTIQYYIILTGEQLTYFRHTAAYLLSRLNPTYCYDGRRIHHYDVCPPFRPPQKGVQLNDMAQQKSPLTPREQQRLRNAARIKNIASIPLPISSSQ